MKRQFFHKGKTQEVVNRQILKSPILLLLFSDFFALYLTFIFYYLIFKWFITIKAGSLN